MADYTVANKNDGDQFSASEHNSLKTAVNSKQDISSAVTLSQVNTAATAAAEAAAASEVAAAITPIQADIDAINTALEDVPTSEDLNEGLATKAPIIHQHAASDIVAGDTITMLAAWQAMKATFPGYVGDGSKMLLDNDTYVDLPTGGSNSAPSISAVTLIGSPVQGGTLTASGTYFDADGDAAGTHIKKYYSFDGPSGSTGQTLLATAASYTLQAGDVGRYIEVGMIPVAATGTSPGVEVRSARSAIVTAVAAQNLILQSEDFTTTWAIVQAGSSVVTPNSTTPPSVALNADTFTSGTGGSFAYILRQSKSYAASTKYYGSIYLKKKGSQRYMGLVIAGSNTGNTWGDTVAWIDLDTGATAVKGSTPPSGLVVSSEADSVTGWWNLIAEFTTGTSGAGGDFFDLNFVDINGVPVSPDGSQEVYVSAAQLTSTTRKPYSKTTTSIIP